MIMLNTMRGDAQVQRQPQFAVGAIIFHKRYGYRGVVVERDHTCQADQDWCEKNQTQPSRDQPWYHVLVHSSGSVTYVAQTSIEHDATGHPVDHPLLDVFFDHFDGTAYHRNHELW